MFPARLKVKYQEGIKIYETVEEAMQDIAKWASASRSLDLQRP